MVFACSTKALVTTPAASIALQDIRIVLTGWMRVTLRCGWKL